MIPFVWTFTGKLYKFFFETTAPTTATEYDLQISNHHPSFKSFSNYVKLLLNFLLSGHKITFGSFEI